MIFKSLAPGNQATITCPIFNVTTKVAACFKLRDMVFAGKRPDQRKGCQCVMRAGKCPATHMIEAMFRGDEDNYFSAEEKNIAVSGDVLRRIAPVLVTDRVMNEFPLTDREREIITNLNDNAGTLHRKMQKDVELEEIEMPARRPPRRYEEDGPVLERKPLASGGYTGKIASSDKTVLAAETGDLSAAITAAIAAPDQPVIEVTGVTSPEKALALARHDLKASLVTVINKASDVPSDSPAAQAVVETINKQLSLLERARLKKGIVA